MNAKVSTLFAVVLLACSTQAFPVPPVAAPATKPGTAPPAIIHALPVEPPMIAKESSGLPPARLCRLGDDCLSVDSRPFEVCQVSSRSCGDKLAEVLRVEKPKRILKPAAPLQTSR